MWPAGPPFRSASRQWALGEEIAWSEHADLAAAARAAITRAEQHADELESANGSQDHQEVGARLAPDAIRRKAAQARLKIAEHRLGDVIRAAKEDGLLGRYKERQGGGEITRIATSLGVSRPTLYGIADGEAWSGPVWA
ncbi:hypothetical protein ABZV67_30900 [Streptomyces sp. NPDC005065]|uniref:hypothetical protein n=1 Tax=unclassified Streptomyces TaxID=2593676 RepID=UPI0033A329EF